MIAPANLSRITIPPWKMVTCLTVLNSRSDNEPKFDIIPTNDKFAAPFHPPVLATQTKNDSLH